MIRKPIVHNDRRTQRINALLENIIRHKVTMHLPGDLSLWLSVDVHRDLKSANVWVYHPNIPENQLLDLMNSWRLEMQQALAQHALRNTPRIRFLWNKIAGEQAQWEEKMRHEASQLHDD